MVTGENEVADGEFPLGDDGESVLVGVAVGFKSDGTFDGELVAFDGVTTTVG